MPGAGVPGPALPVRPATERTLCVWRAEPVGAKAPSLAMDSTVIALRRREGQAFAVLCQAQAHPAPAFR